MPCQGRILVVEITTEVDTNDIIKDLGGNYKSFELLLFFCHHPDTRFSRNAINHAIEAEQLEIATALNELIEKKIVVLSTQNNIGLYSLTKEEPVHSLASILMNIDYSQRCKILKKFRILPV